MKYELDLFGGLNATLYVEAVTEEQVLALKLLKDLLEKLDDTERGN